jgi:hypothetical protein
MSKVDEYFQHTYHTINRAIMLLLKIATMLLFIRVKNYFFKVIVFLNNSLGLYMSMH